MEVSEFEKKRADNLILNSARNYSLHPEFRVFDADGKAELYWNSVIGAVYRRQDREALQTLYRSFRGRRDQLLYESLFWIGLECAVYPGEAAERPVFPALRREYASEALKHLCPGVSSEDDAAGRAERILAGHLRRILDMPESFCTEKYSYNDEECFYTGEGSFLPVQDVKLLDALEACAEYGSAGSAPAGEGAEKSEIAGGCGDLTGRLRNILTEHCGYAAEERAPEEDEAGRPFFLPSFVPSFHFFAAKRTKRRAAVPAALRRLAFAYGEHVDEETEGRIVTNLLGSTDVVTEKRTEEGIRQFIRQNFGRAVLSDRELLRMEQDCCTGIHEHAKLYVTRGEYPPELRSHGVRFHIQEDALEQRKKNRRAYLAEGQAHRTAVFRLTEQIRNSILMHLDEHPLRSQTGELVPGKLWRAELLSDDRVFRKIHKEDLGNLTVDILLDASRSQTVRNRMVSAQGYMIAESLTRCGIPCRVYSFCSMNGYTILNLFRDYGENEKNEEIFRYFTAGANRDGLGIRLAAEMMRGNHAEHRLLVVLSDCKPNDPLMVRDAGGVYRNYEKDLAVEDTAAEVHRARLDGISVVCVYTGSDEDLTAAKRIYGQEFTRIRTLSQFADRVARLLKEGISAI